MFETWIEDTGGKLLPFNPRILHKHLDPKKLMPACSRCNREAMDAISAMLVTPTRPISIAGDIAPKGARHIVGAGKEGATVLIRKFTKQAAYAGADTFRKRGGMSGGPTGGNGSVGRFADVVPQAFVR